MNRQYLKNVKEIDYEVCKMDLIGLEYDQITGSWEEGKKTFVSMKDQLSNC
jgi:hypothetical protein